MLDERFHVYIMATRKDGPIYVGITNDLTRRVYEHKAHARRSFTMRYNIDRLVWNEAYDNPVEAIAREKQLKKWRRAWKVALIEENNPEWLDLAGALLGDFETGQECHPVRGATRSGASQTRERRRS